MRNNKGRFVKGHEVPQEWRDIASKLLKGNALHTTPHSEETKLKISKSHKKSGRFVREKNPAWKGGNSVKRRYCDSYDVRVWRTKIFERDDFTCQVCKERGCNLNAHHIYSWREYPELRFDTTNGITLCVACHNKTKQKEHQFEYMFNAINEYNHNDITRGG